MSDRLTQLEHVTRPPKFAQIEYVFALAIGPLAHSVRVVFFPLPIVLKLTERDRNTGASDFVAVYLQSSFYQ